MKKVFTKTIYTIAALFFLVGMSVPAFAQFTLNTITSGAHASAMARDAAGNVYVIEDPSNGTSGGEIVKYTAGTGAGTIIYNGSLISGTDYNGTDDDYAFGITVATNGDIYFTTSNNTGNNFYGNVVKLTFNGGTSYTASVLISGNGNVGYFAGVAIDNANELFVLQYDVAGNSGDGSYEVAKYNTSGVQQSILYDKLETNYALPGTFTAITGLACDPTGTYVYVADWFIENNNSYGGFIEKLTKNGATYTASQLASGTYCTALACDASGNLYATASTYATLSTYKLVEYVGGAGSPVTLYSNLGSDGYNFYPFGIAVESSTSIFVLNGSSGTGTKGDYDQLVGPPTTQASSVSFSSTTENNTVISWTNGGGASRAVFVEAGTTGTPTVSNTTSYTASTTLGNGSTAGSGWYCVYNGTGSSVSITGLSAATTYRAMVVEYNGSTGYQNYYTATATLNPNNVTTPAAPTLTASGGSDSYSTGSPAVTVDAGITATAGQANLSSALVFISNNYSAGDLLNFTNQNGITGSYSAGTLTLTGTATPANYQTALASVTFSSTSSTASTRTIAFRTNDGTANSNTVTKSMVVTISTTLSSIALVNASINNLSSVQYTVTFAAAVSGLTASNFTATVTSGSISGQSVTGVSGANPYTVTVNTGSGSGSLRLDMANSSGLSPGVSNVPYTSGPAYTIDKTAPTITISSPSLSSTTTGPVTYTVTYADANFNTSTLTTSNITLNKGGTANGTIGLSGSGTSYTVTISSITGAGTLGISIAAGTASDQAGNLAPASGASSTFNVLSTDASLSNITLSVGYLKHPYFASNVYNYASYVGSAISSDTVTPTSTDANATIKVNGSTVASGSASAPINLNFGQNLITIVVTAQDGSTTLTYTDTLYRALSTNSNLFTLKTSHGALTPTFSNTTLSYTQSVAYEITSISYTPTTVDANATVTVGSSATASGTASVPQSLTPGDNLINIVVTAQDGSSKTFAITVTRAKSSNSNLLTLKTSHGALTPGFSNTTLSYTKSVPYGLSSITFTPTTVDANATVTVGGSPTASGTASVAQTLDYGDNLINIVVTAQDGSSKTFAVTVTRAKSTNDNLLSLTTNHGGLTQSPPQSTSYIKNVPNSVTSITFTPTTVDTNATVTVGGSPTASGTASVDQPLSVGDNVISIVVTAQDGVTSQTYTVTVTRAMGSMNTVYQPMAVSNPTINSLKMAEDGILVHQGISPNGDGANDFLLIEGINSHPDNKLQIMNRSGQLVFEAKGYDNSTKVFDGHSNKTGAMQTPGTYFYSLDYVADGVTKHKTGFIVLKY